MSTVLLALLMMVVMAAIIFGVLAGLGAWSLNRRNRLAADIETGAPLQWLWSPTQPARLHRRLQSAVAPIHAPAKTRLRLRAAGPASEPPVGIASTLDDVCRSLTGQATAVDRDVIHASRLPRRARRARLRVLQVEVAEIERLTVRVGHHRAAQTQPATLLGEPPRTRGETLANIEGHLDVLADAHTELRAIEQANGLDDPEHVLRRIAGQPQSQPEPRPGPPPQALRQPAHDAPAPPRPAPPRPMPPLASTRRATARRAAR